MSTRFDVTSLGSTMIRLSVPRGERLERAAMYEVRTAGTESNTMVALSRMGKRAAWVSRLTDNALGRRISEEIQSFGVDTARVVWTDEDRNEVFFVEYGARPRPIQVIYDRENSAISKVSIDSLDVDYLLDTRILHLTGILAALGEDCAETMRKLMDSASSAGVKLSFDVNYRSKLWSTQSARATLTPMMSRADILLITREDALNVFGITGSPEEIVSAVYQRFQPEVCVVTLGCDGGISFDGDAFCYCSGYDVDTVDRLGAGDSFTAGVLCGYLEGALQMGMNYASAMSALKLGIHGDYFTSSKTEVLGILNQHNGLEITR